MGDVRNITLSYTFFKTDEEDEEDDSGDNAQPKPAAGQQRVDDWRKTTAAELAGTAAAPLISQDEKDAA